MCENESFIFYHFFVADITCAQINEHFDFDAYNMYLQALLMRSDFANATRPNNKALIQFRCCCFARKASTVPVSSTAQSEEVFREVTHDLGFLLNYLLAQCWKLQQFRTPLTRKGTIGQKEKKNLELVLCKTGSTSFHFKIPSGEVSG